LQEELKSAKKEAQILKVKQASMAFQGQGPTVLTGAAPGEVELSGGAKLVAREVRDLDKDGLRALVDQHRGQIKSGVVVLASPSDGKVSIVVGVTPDLTKKIPAGQVVKQLAPIVGGGGGGRPDFAEAGGKDPSKIDELLAASKGVIEKMLSAT
jgi:alanyl-tRNA synthetase